jgi:hypothetical protein
MGYSNKVKVITNVSSTSGETADEFDDVGAIRVSDGHLSLFQYGAADTAVAVYAPGQWKRFKRQTEGTKA